MEMDRFAELREVIESIQLVDAHAHNIVSFDSTLPFISCFSEAAGDALLLHAPHTLSFKRSLRDIAQLYGCEPSLQAVEGFRKASGLQAIASKCFEAANFSAVLIDDGLKLDKMFGIDWHTTLGPTIHRVLRIEHLAEQILDEATPKKTIRRGMDPQSLKRFNY
uniref:Amidohydrolase-related domain-containing protein n=1 Tax=Kalanchoe fedtschenkoi TaxID=63787 RepID=A0A7N0UVI2_KALFE